MSEERKVDVLQVLDDALDCMRDRRTTVVGYTCAIDAVAELIRAASLYRKLRTAEAGKRLDAALAACLTEKTP